MKTIEAAFAPYNFSTTRCYVIGVNVRNYGYMKLEYKLPNYIKKLKGIYISANCEPTPLTCIGIASLNFNGQAFKSYHIPVLQTAILPGQPYPLACNEPILSNGFLQGYYEDFINSKNYPYSICIYLHYEP